MEKYGVPENDRFSGWATAMFKNGLAELREWFRSEKLQRSRQEIEQAASMLRTKHTNSEIAHSSHAKTRYMTRISYVSEVDAGEQRDVFWMVERNKSNVAKTTTTVVILDEGVITEVSSMTQEKNSDEPKLVPLDTEAKDAFINKLAKELSNVEVMVDLAQDQPHKHLVIS